MLGGTSDGLRASPRKDAAFPARVWAGSRWGGYRYPGSGEPPRGCGAFGLPGARSSSSRYNPGYRRSGTAA